MHLRLSGHLQHRLGARRHSYSTLKQFFSQLDGVDENLKLLDRIHICVQNN
jgi:hypothetical protein